MNLLNKDRDMPQILRMAILLGVAVVFCPRARPQRVDPEVKAADASVNPVDAETRKAGEGQQNAKTKPITPYSRWGSPEKQSPTSVWSAGGSVFGYKKHGFGSAERDFTPKTPAPKAGVGTARLGANAGVALPSSDSPTPANRLLDSHPKSGLVRTPSPGQMVIKAKPGISAKKKKSPGEADNNASSTPRP